VVERSGLDVVEGTAPLPPRPGKISPEARYLAGGGGCGFPGSPVYFPPSPVECVESAPIVRFFADFTLVKPPDWDLDPDTAWDFATTVHLGKRLSGCALPN
jgi:hypothetical protein